MCFHWRASGHPWGQERHKNASKKPAGKVKLKYLPYQPSKVWAGMQKMHDTMSLKQECDWITRITKAFAWGSLSGVRLGWMRCRTRCRAMTLVTLPMAEPATTTMCSLTLLGLGQEGAGCLLTRYVQCHWGLCWSQPTFIADERPSRCSVPEVAENAMLSSPAGCLSSREVQWRNSFYPGSG